MLTILHGEKWRSEEYECLLGNKKWLLENRND